MEKFACVDQEADEMIQALVKESGISIKLKQCQFKVFFFFFLKEFKGFAR